MDVLISDPATSRMLIRHRKAIGADRRDEVWDGVYIVSPAANDEHLDLDVMLVHALVAAVRIARLGLVQPGANITDRTEKWTKNYRCPDVAVLLNGTKAINKKTHWLGGPDFAIEIISPRDRSRAKLDFYAKVGVKELLLVDRKPWALELYRLQDGVLVLVGISTLDRPEVLRSEVVPLSFHLAPGESRPTIELVHHDGLQLWSA